MMSARLLRGIEGRTRRNSSLATVVCRPYLTCRNFVRRLVYNMLHRLALLIVLRGAVFLPAIAGAQTLNSKPAFPTDNPTGPVADCGEPCHRSLISDLSRGVTVNVSMPFSGQTRRVQYAAGWIHGEDCPEGRIEIARRIVGTRQSSAFLASLFDKGFCPRAIFDETSSDAPYLASRVWNDTVFDAERARLLTRDEYDRLVVPPIRQILSSQEPTRWAAFSLFVGASPKNADLLAAEISEFLADPNPSARQETASGDSSKMKNISKVSDVVTRNGSLVESLLNDLDTTPQLLMSPGYRQLIDNLAGISSSVPTWGSPPVCANADRIAKHLPWGSNEQRDTKYLATLSRCDSGSENLLRLTLLDSRPSIVATSLRVWWAAAASGRPAAVNVAPNVIALIENEGILGAAAVPVYRFTGRAQITIQDSTPIEEVALGLSTLGLLSETVESLNAAGKTKKARALFQGLQRGMQRLTR